MRPATVSQAIHCVAGSLVGAYPGAYVSWDDCDIGSGHTHGSVMLVDGAKCLIRCKGGDVVPMWTKDLHVELSNPLAMCHAARWLATQMGCDPGETSPWWTHYPCGVFCPGDNDPNRPDFWVLCCSTGFVVWFVDADEPDDMKVDQDGNRYISVAGLKSARSPAEALAAACVAVGGAQ